MSAVLGPIERLYKISVGRAKGGSAIRVLFTTIGLLLPFLCLANEALLLNQSSHKQSVKPLLMVEWAGDKDIRLVAAEVKSTNSLISVPKLVDDGTHGDATANDDKYSYRFATPIAKGSYELVFYAVSTDGQEYISDIFLLSVE